MIGSANLSWTNCKPIIDWFSKPIIKLGQYKQFPTLLVSDVDHNLLMLWWVVYWVHLKWHKSCSSTWCFLNLHHTNDMTHAHLHNPAGKIWGEFTGVTLASLMTWSPAMSCKQNFMWIKRQFQTHVLMTRQIRPGLTQRRSHHRC